MKWTSTHGTDASDIYISDGWELIRKVLGFGLDRATIIRHGVKVHQIEAQDGLGKAMDWTAGQGRNPNRHCDGQRYRPSVDSLPLRTGQERGRTDHAGEGDEAQAAHRRAVIGVDVISMTETEAGALMAKKLFRRRF